MTSQPVCQPIGYVIHIMHTYTGHGRRKYIPQSMRMVTKLRFNKYLWMLMTEGDPTVFKKKTWMLFKHSGKGKSQGSLPMYFKDYDAYTV